MEVLKSAAHEVSFPSELQNVHLHVKNPAPLGKGVKKNKGFIG